MLTVILMAAGLSACASTHERTEMDRELALKLADKTPVVVTAPAPVVNVNNYAAPQASYQSTQAPSSDETVIRTAQELAVMQAGQENCTMSPQYDWQGNLIRTVRRCFGGK